MTASISPPVPQRGTLDPAGLSLCPISFGEIPDFGLDDHFEAFQVFLRSCAAIAAKTPPLRACVAPSLDLERVAHKALRQEVHDNAAARRFFEDNFRPCRFSGAAGAAQGPGLLTGYYEPIAGGSLTRTPEFTAPVLARPDNHTLLAPYPDRVEIEAGALGSSAKPLLWLRDPVEVFLAQVQGSARVRLTDGKVLRLVYAGRNGHPYTSIGKILIESGEIEESVMSLAALKNWIRARGQRPGDEGLALMHRNKSYVFFALETEFDQASGPIGGQGIALTPLRSLAADRAIWPYGLPFWICAELPWRSSIPTPFRRLMIAQDTGSAIMGPVRCDIFFGTGDDAGARAGDIRHTGEVIVLLPAGEAAVP